MTEPGVWRSDVEGHLFVLKMKPTVITCITCMETCARDAHTNFTSFAKAAVAFVEKHGALDVKIADSILQLIPPTASEPTK